MSVSPLCKILLSERVEKKLIEELPKVVQKYPEYEEKPRVDPDLKLHKQYWGSASMRTLPSMDEVVKSYVEPNGQEDSIPEETGSASELTAIKEYWKLMLMQTRNVIKH